MLRQVLIAISSLFLLCSCAEGQDISQLVKTGQSKEQIRNAIGNPGEVTVVIKSQEYIWGPEESFWSKIPIGAKFEVWRYQSEAGQLNLYFLNNSDNLSYKAFAPTGVVYESSE